MNTDLLTSEQRYRLQVVESARSVADALETLIKYADKAFYTDDDDDLDAHQVSDSEWFQNDYPFESIEVLQRKVQRWALHLRININDDLLTENTNA